MLDWVAGVLTSTKTATDITRVLVDMRTDAAVQAKVIDLSMVLMQLQQQLMAAQSEQMNLINRIRELESALNEANQRNDKREKYQLHTFETGNVAYALKPEYAHTAIEHYLCIRCFDTGDCITMQSDGVASIWSGYKCPQCGTVAAKHSMIKNPRQ